MLPYKETEEQIRKINSTDMWYIINTSQSTRTSNRNNFVNSKNHKHESHNKLVAKPFQNQPSFFLYNISSNIFSRHIRLCQQRFLALQHLSVFPWIPDCLHSSTNCIHFTTIHFNYLQSTIDFDMLCALRRWHNQLLHIPRKIHSRFLVYFCTNKHTRNNRIFRGLFFSNIHIDYTLHSFIYYGKLLHIKKKANRAEEKGFL